MDTRSENPDFIVDAMGQVEDVRHRKFVPPRASQAHRAPAAMGGPRDKGGHSQPMQNLWPRVVLIPVPIGLFALLGWLVLNLIVGAGN